MALMRKAEWPMLTSPGWLTDFFDTERFLDNDWLRRSSALPAVNVNEKEKEFEIEMAVPGMKKSDFKIEQENSTLTISSEKEEETEEKKRDYMRREFNYSSFCRSFNLPENCSEDRISANYQDGILKVTIPKKVATKEKLTRPIEVR
jgi:HSP20 family protein